MTKFERWEMFHSGYNYVSKYYVNYKTDMLKDILKAMRLLRNPVANGIATAICHELRKRKGVLKMFKTYEFISPKVTYECPLCCKKYDTYDESKDCIEKHSIPESIIFYDLMSEKNNCPAIIYVKLNDGREAKYAFHEIIKEKGGETDDIA